MFFSIQLRKNKDNQGILWFFYVDILNYLVFLSN